jgi:hypothetical protein
LKLLEEFPPPKGLTQEAKKVMDARAATWMDLLMGGSPHMVKVILNLNYL